MNNNDSNNDNNNSANKKQSKKIKINNVFDEKIKYKTKICFVFSTAKIKENFYIDINLSNLFKSVRFAILNSFLLLSSEVGETLCRFSEEGE